MYNKKFQRMVAGIIAGLLVAAMLVTGIMAGLGI